MNKIFSLIACCLITSPLFSQDAAGWISTLPHAKDYVQHRASSYDRSGANADARRIAPGATLTLLDEGGPGLITHMWVTIASDDPHHLKALVLRMYWDGENTPSVEAPIGDFFGLGLGEYHYYQSLALSVSSDKALNCFMPMPFQKHARITVTNEGSIKTDAFYFNIDYRAYSKALSSDQLYLHAQYRQETPANGWSNQWKSNGEATVNDKKNLNGEGNLVWMEAAGRGHFVGVTMSVLQNQDGWWGRWREDALDQWDWVRGLFPGSLGFWGTSVFVCAVWSAGSRQRSGGRALIRIPVSLGFAASVYQVIARDYGAWARECAVGQLFFGCLLVSE